MASLHRQPGRPNWFCAYTDHGRRRFRSTKTADKKRAWQICNAWVKAAALGENLSPDRAREIIASGVADVLTVSGKILPTASVEDWCERWLELKEVENEPRTHERYEVSIRRLLRFLGPKAKVDLTMLSADDLIQFRDSTAKLLSATSCNMDLKVIRSCLAAAVRQDILVKNVAKNVAMLKQRGEHRRRAFTLEEIHKVLLQCDEQGGEWRGLVLTALYTGQRLGDVACLTWQQVDLNRQEISFVTAKTGKRLCIALAKPLLDYFQALPSVDDPKDFVFPRAAAAAEKRSGTLSVRFYDEVLSPAGLVPSRPKVKRPDGKGRGWKRVPSELSFHSFRHTLTTWLKSSGASNALAQMIIGHDSELVSRGYTHLGPKDTVETMSRLPDVTLGKS
jgi:integrase